LVIALEKKVARWARNIIDLGGGNHFVPRVLSLSGVPEVTDDQQAREDPELAVLSAIAHARDPDMNKSIRIALLAKIASIGLDADRSKLYCDLVLNYLPEAAQQAIQTMDSRTDALKKALEYDIYIAGMAGVLLVQLAGRFGDLAPEVEESLRESSVEQLLAISDRLSSALTLDDALASGVGARRGETLFSQLAGYRAERACR